MTKYYAHNIKNKWTEKWMVTRLPTSILTIFGPFDCGELYGLYFRFKKKSWLTVTVRTSFFSRIFNIEKCLIFDCQSQIQVTYRIYNGGMPFQNVHERLRIVRHVLRITFGHLGQEHDQLFQIFVEFAWKQNLTNLTALTQKVKLFLIAQN